jgi:hydrogenase maturation protease
MERFSMRCAAKVLILGYGSMLRGDDSFGHRVAARLSAAIDDPAIDIRELHQLAPELADPVSQAELVIFIDAARAGVPGELRREPVFPAEAGALTHHMTPSALLACARALYGRSPRGVLFTAAGLSFDYSATLSAPMEAAAREAARQVLSLLQEL